MFWLFLYASKYIIYHNLSAAQNFLIPTKKSEFTELSGECLKVVSPIQSGPGKLWEILGTGSVFWDTKLMWLYQMIFFKMNTEREITKFTLSVPVPATPSSERRLRVQDPVMCSSPRREVLLERLLKTSCILH